MAINKPQYKVIVSAEAEAMLLEHARFLARVSEKAAAQLVEDFLVLVGSLETMPERFSAFERGGYRLMGYRQAIFCKRYLAIFCVEEQAVFLDFVVDCRRDNRELLESVKV